MVTAASGGRLSVRSSSMRSSGFAWWLEEQQPDSRTGFGWSGDLDGEFDPGSGRTLAACLTHASRTRSRSLLRGTVANG